MSLTLSDPSMPATQSSLRPDRQGRLVVLTGPSGVGKGTVIQQLRQRHERLHFSVSITTRPPRPGEQEGINYYFRSREQFLEMIESGKLLEWAEYAKNFYGTPLDPVEEKLQQGFDVLLEIELAGARQVVEKRPDAIRIFLKPPSMDELERRLRDRAQDSEASIQRRLTQARAELDALDEFDHVIINDDVDQAIQELEELLYFSPRANPAHLAKPGSVGPAPHSQQPEDEIHPPERLPASRSAS